MQTSKLTKCAGEKRCEHCGQAPAMPIAGYVLCLDCYHLFGSCCLEFGGDDLWDDVFPLTLRQRGQGGRS